MRPRADVRPNTGWSFRIGSACFDIAATVISGQPVYVGYRDGEAVTAAHKPWRCLARMIRIEQRYRLLLTAAAPMGQVN